MVGEGGGSEQTVEQRGERLGTDESNQGNSTVSYSRR